MSPTTQAEQVRGKRLAALTSLVVVLGCSAAIWGLDGPPVLGRWNIPWWVFIPVYIAFSQWSLEFVRKRESTHVTLTQLPLVLGLVLLSPLEHLAARMTASLASNAIKRRDPLKTTVNLAIEGAELAVAIAVLSTLRPIEAPTSGLWITLVLALLLSDATSAVLMQVILRLLGITFSRHEARETVLAGAATSSLFAGIGILTLSAVWTDPSTIVAVAALAGTLIYGYRLLRRRSSQQQSNDKLHGFVKDLRPIDMDSSEVVQVLHRVRDLLHAKTLELDTFPSAVAPGRRVSVDVSGTSSIDLDPEALTARLEADLSEDRMRTPVMADGVVIALLCARQRIGSDRGFDPQDLRLLDTVATELATAFDRGRMVTDLRNAATRDPLTDLPNLRQTASDLDRMLVSDSIVLATVAVDSFREVNDTLGHLVGDELLCEVATRLRAACPHGVVGRIGGGRFAVAVMSQDAGDDPALFGLGLRTAVEGGAQLGSITTHIRLSVGCVRGPEHGSDASTLLRRAETAMYSARNAHGGPVIWEPAYEVQGQRRLAVVMALREAIASNAIGVAYQPKVCATTGQVLGVEALARWTHPALGGIAPDEFIPLAEASGLMAGLTSSVLRQALTACHGWQRRGGPVGVAVNVSADTVLDPEFVTDVNSILQSVGVAPGLLTLELTESVVVNDPALAAERMQELRALGVRLSVDDFGTGYSSLTYLKGLPINEVKIDKGFVAGLVNDSGDQAIVRAVVDIAHTLGMRVVAEGVEQTDQQELLRRLGVDELQGYLFARPMPALGMAAWIRRQENQIQR